MASLTPARIDYLDALFQVERKSLQKYWGHVYLIEHPHGFVKIGYAKNVALRFASIQIGSPYPLTLLEYHKALFPHLVERRLHALFLDKHARGEWHRLEPDDITYITEGLKKFSIASEDHYREFMKPRNVEFYEANCVGKTSAEITAMYGVFTEAEVEVSVKDIFSKRL